MLPICPPLWRGIGSRSLGEFPLDVVRIECPRCDRAGSYRRDGLLARFGPTSPCPICSWRRRHAIAGTILVGDAG